MNTETIKLLGCVTTFHRIESYVWSRIQATTKGKEFPYSEFKPLADRANGLEEEAESFPPNVLTQCEDAMAGISDEEVEGYRQAWELERGEQVEEDGFIRAELLLVKLLKGAK